MMKKAEVILAGKNECQLYPFFWQHGEPLEVIDDYIDKITGCGITNLTIESRPHPEFLEEGWWKTMDHIVKRARNEKLKLWILDDARFPTGFANGKVPEHLKKRYLQLHRFDIVGTGNHMTLSLENIAGMMACLKNPNHQKDRIIKVILAEKMPEDLTQVNFETLQDITHLVHENELIFRPEKKHYGVFVLYETPVGEEDATKDYLDPMNPEGTDVLLSEVYEKHYTHYKEDFGSVITGFFSDEPRFGNVKGPYSVIGKDPMPLPWNEFVFEKLRELVPEEEWVYLFQSDSSRAGEVRQIYMDIVSSLFQENFVKHIQSWCHDHGVEYYGHFIEDNGAHCRLGYGPGHYFRAASGMDMAGIDIIGGQVVPGMDYWHDAFSTGGSDGEFYHHLLPKLAQSEARLNPNKKGRVMCEAFGAYGWIEGLKMMKWITDFMISKGVNYIVPHAFDPKEFPDWDCPPHFYAHGNNPQFEYFDLWTGYANRLCSLFADGRSLSEIGVLYHAFGEWSGLAMPDQKIFKVLHQNQLDGTVISEDYLMNAGVESGRFSISDYDFKVLIVPEIDRLPEAQLEKIARIAQQVSVFFINKMPEGYKGEGRIVSLKDLASAVAPICSPFVKTEGKNPDLHVMSYEHEDGLVHFLFNHSILDSVKTAILLDPEKHYAIFDAMENKMAALPEGTFNLPITLEPYESMVLLESDMPFEGCQTYISQAADNKEVICSYKPAFCQKTDYKHQTTYTNDNLEHFSGTIVYENKLELEDNLPSILEIPKAYEIISVLVNDQDCGTKICPPYRFDISEAIKPGINTISISAVNNLARALRDGFSAYIPMEPAGIVSDVLLKA